MPALTLLIRRTCLTLVLAVFALPALAQEKSLRAMIPWDGEGRIYQVAEERMMFLGALEGIIYIESAEGVLDEGFVSCPLTQVLDTTSKATTATGHCMIVPSSGDAVYARWTCTGQVGGCKGEFTLTGGTGRFQGISGTSEFVVRSPLRQLIPDMASGSLIRVSGGIAVLPKLVYRMRDAERR